LPGRLESFLSGLREYAGFVDANVEHIRRFMEYCFSTGLCPARVYKYVQTLARVSRFMQKDFMEVTREDVERFVASLERNRRLSAWTKQNYKVVLKKFFKWLKGDGERYPPEVEWITTTLKSKDTLLPSELLTEEDVMRLVEAASNIRDKAFIITLYESGARIGELASMRIADAQFNEKYVTLILKGKTGSRRVPVVASMPYLLNWIQNHPKKNRKDAPLFCGLHDGKPLSYGAFSKILKETAARAGLKKNVHPHAFRHSRATFLAKKLTEAQMNAYFGWRQGSRMPSIYVHLSGRDIDEDILGIYGLREAEHEEPAIKPKTCPRCGFLNPIEAKICNRCGLALSIEAAASQEEDLYFTAEEVEALKKLLQLMKNGKIKITG